MAPYPSEWNVSKNWDLIKGARPLVKPEAACVRIEGSGRFRDFRVVFDSTQLDKALVEAVLAEPEWSGVA